MRRHKEDSRRWARGGRPPLPALASPTPLESRGDTERRLELSIAELEREERLVETLYRVAQVVAEKDDLHELVQAVTDETTAITGAQFGAFFYNVVRRDGEILSLYTISGVPKERFERFPSPRATDIFRPTFEGTAIVRLDDVLVDPRFGQNAPYHGMPPGHLPVRSYLAVPVFTRDGSVVGGLVFGHEDVGVFSEEDERIAVGIATQAGTAIERARLLAAERNARAEAEAKADAAISLECVEDGVIMVDNDGVVRLWNRAATTITGLPAESILGRPIGQAVPGWESIALDIPVGEAHARVAPCTLPLDTLRGRELWLSLYGVEFSDGTVYAFRDVSGEHELEALRADVIATVSHELRTPVAAVYGAAQTLQHRSLAPEITSQLLEVLGAESERLTRLVDEILLTSQIDSGRVGIARDSISALEGVEAVVRAALVAGNGMSIAVETPDGVVPNIAADSDKFRQVLSNLVENALRYGKSSAGGTVIVRLRSLRGRARIEVVDQGPGIPGHEHSRIFEKFYRLDPHMKLGVRGTGLGLYICRELIHRMQGTIGVISSAGSGATFWIELPFAWTDSSEADGA